MPTVTYAKLFNLGNYENERIELEDEVRSDETIMEAFERVRVWVEGQGAEQRRKARRGEILDDIESRISSAKNRFAGVERKHKDAIKKYGQLRDLLAKHGVPIPELDMWDLSPIEQPSNTLASDDDTGDDDTGDDDDAEGGHP